MRAVRERNDRGSCIGRNHARTLAIGCNRSETQEWQTHWQEDAPVLVATPARRTRLPFELRLPRPGAIIHNHDTNARSALWSVKYVCWWPSRAWMGTTAAPR